MRAKTAVVASVVLAASPAMATTVMEECLVQSLESASDDTTVGTLRALCAEKLSASDTTSDQSLLFEYIRSDTDIENRNYLVSVHKQNYFLAYTNNSDLNLEPWRQATTPENVDAFRDEEAIFQVSAKMPIWRNLFSRNMDLYFGYTQKSWWQIYTDEAELSSPFRETNYEPEVFARYYGGPRLGSLGRVAAMDFGVVHQSNGRADISDGALNRSWDRVMARAVMEFGNNLAVSIRGWWAYDESDDNPNLYQYLGYGDVRAVWAPNKHTVSLMVRPGTRKAGVEASWSYPLTDLVRIYAQYYNGYGESLLDYNAKTNRFGIGLMTSDFIMNK